MKEPPRPGSPEARRRRWGNARSILWLALFDSSSGLVLRFAVALMVGVVVVVGGLVTGQPSLVVFGAILAVIGVVLSVSSVFVRR